MNALESTRTVRRLVLAVICAATAFAVTSTDAHAATIIKDPSPPEYKVEIEPHLNVQYIWADQFGGRGLGPGVRFSIPIISPGFIKKLNNSVAIGFGPDILYSHSKNDICAGNDCQKSDAFWALYFPVVMQWNFWLTEKWSVFGEPGIVGQTAFGAGCDSIDRKCKKASPIFGAFYAGARYHFSDALALTLRAGYPNGISVGLSIF